jgi:16S rRNA (guanine527-N7)-methyltransferase
MRNAEESLRTGLEALRLPLGEEQISQLLAYQALISKWTKVYNLTAVRDPVEMVTHHLLDSLAVIAPLQRQLALLDPADETAAKRRLLDVGSGAGLPGVVIAICCPDMAVTCVDTVAKKAAFIRQAALALKLTQLSSVHARVETLAPPGMAAFDVVCSRAFASLADFCDGSAAALAERGVWMAMKGRQPADEIALLPPAVDVFHVEQLQVPGLDAERCIVWMRKKAV